MSEEQVIMNKTERPCSFEFGKAGKRHKVYYKDAEDLKNQLNELVEAGFAKEEDFKDVQ